MRVFLSATRSDVRELAGTRRLTGQLAGFAATAELTTELGIQGEELDLALAVAAAEGSRARQLERGGSEHGRRVVVVAELPETAVEMEDRLEGRIHTTGTVELAQVEALLADAEPLALSDPGPEELAWFATQEIAVLD